MSIRSFVWAIPVSLVCTVMIVGFVTPMSSRAAGPAPQESIGNKVFDLHISKGQYCLTAFGNTGQKDVTPLSRCRYLADKDLKITVHPGVSEEGERVWRHEERSQGVKIPGSPTGWGQQNCQDRVQEGNAMEDVPATLEDISKLAGIGGVQIYRIPYAKVNGEIRFILIVLADTPDPFSKILTVPKTDAYAKYNWDVWPDSH